MLWSAKQAAQKTAPAFKKTCPIRVPEANQELINGSTEAESYCPSSIPLGNHWLRRGIVLRQFVHQPISHVTPVWTQAYEMLVRRRGVKGGASKGDGHAGRKGKHRFHGSILHRQAVPRLHGSATLGSHRVTAEISGGSPQSGPTHQLPAKSSAAGPGRYPLSLGTRRLGPAPRAIAVPREKHPTSRA